MLVLSRSLCVCVSVSGEGLIPGPPGHAPAHTPHLCGVFLTPHCACFPGLQPGSTEGKGEQRCRSEPEDSQGVVVCSASPRSVVKCQINSNGEGGSTPETVQWKPECLVSVCACAPIVTLSSPPPCRLPSPINHKSCQTDS